MNLHDISWQVDEATYRNDPALHYSKLKKYAVEGFSMLLKPEEETYSESMLFGSVVDCLITEGIWVFDQKYLVSDTVISTGKVKDIIEYLYSLRTSENSFDDVTDGTILDACNKSEFQPKWKPGTKIENIRKNGAEYYDFLIQASLRTVISQEMFDQATSVVQCLKTHPATAELFADDTEDIVHEYQLKFKTELNGVVYKCMPDLVIINHKTKTIAPYDLKTTSWFEFDFPQQFIHRHYDLQARLYYKILKQVIKNTPLNDYELLDWTFIVVNKKNLSPLLWKYSDTKKDGTLCYGVKSEIQRIDPEQLGKELHDYMETEATVPKGILTGSENNLTDWLMKL